MTAKKKPQEIPPDISDFSHTDSYETSQEIVMSSVAYFQHVKCS